MRIITLLLLFTQAVSLAAQNTACGTAIKANRNKRVCCHHIEPVYTSFLYKGQVHIEQRHQWYQKGEDTVSVTKSGKTISSFRCRDYVITSPFFAEYDEAGTLRQLDSFIETVNPYGCYDYYAAYRAPGLLVKKKFYRNGKPEYERYYNRAQKDSVLRTWYENGVRRQFVYYTKTDGLDSLSLYWDSSGILRSEESYKMKMEYYESGILKSQKYYRPFASFSSYSETGMLQSHSYDTLLRGYTVNCTRTYYDNGILKSVEYHYHGQPCYTWLYYSENGLLIQSVNKDNATEMLVMPEPIAIEAGPGDERFISVNSTAHYQGDFNAYIEKRAGEILCKSRKKLEGEYKIIFEVSETGSVKFKKMAGTNTAEILIDMKTMIEETDKRWKPALVGNNIASQTLFISFEIRE